MKLSPRSIERLNGVHPELVSVFKRAAETTTVPFIITSGVRTAAQQKRPVQNAERPNWTDTVESPAISRMCL